MAVESSLRGQVEQRIHGESATDGLGTADQRSDEPPPEPRGLCGLRASQERADGAGHLGRAGATDAACPITIWILLKMIFMDSQVARDLESPQPPSLRSWLLGAQGRGVLGLRGGTRRRLPGAA